MATYTAKFFQQGHTFQTAPSTGDWESKYSSIWPCGGHFHSDNHRALFLVTRHLNERWFKGYWQWQSDRSETSSFVASSVFLTLDCQVFTLASGGLGLHRASFYCKLNLRNIILHNILMDQLSGFVFFYYSLNYDSLFPWWLSALSLCKMSRSSRWVDLIQIGQ